MFNILGNAANPFAHMPNMPFAALSKIRKKFSKGSACCAFAERLGFKAPSGFDRDGKFGMPPGAWYGADPNGGVCCWTYGFAKLACGAFWAPFGATFGGGWAPGQPFGSCGICAAGTWHLAIDTYKLKLNQSENDLILQLLPEK